MKKILFLLTLFFNLSYAQVEDAWVYFKDKPSSNIYLDTPLLMLSQRSLDRRSNQEIEIDLKDIPVEASYITTISGTTGITVLAKSKWLNALHIQGEKTDIDLLTALISVDSIQFMNSALNKSINRKVVDKFNNEKITEVAELSYGVTENQMTMLKGDFLHDLGFTGTGLQIAILDAGFKGVESFTAFTNLHDGQSVNGEILGGYDYVNRSDSYYVDNGSTHGLSVLSTIGGYIEHQYIGSAPNAEFYLFVTEDVGSETPLEESLWVEAAERADSLGVDIINTSLGYTTFDDSSYNYSYADMDGKTTFISRGAEIACSKGMLLVTSAGNEGNSSWRYISAPADVASVLTVGGVDENEVIASFSSFGPTSDSRVKPEVLSQGKNVYVINAAGNIATSNGTSFSSPLMAGMVACLWEAFPDKTSNEIKNLVVESSDLFNNPTDQRGYGVPDFESIYTLLSVPDNQELDFKLYPNPINDFLNIEVDNIEEYRLKVYNVLGTLMLERSFIGRKQAIDISFLQSGIYILELLSNEKKIATKFLKN